MNPWTSAVVGILSGMLAGCTCAASHVVVDGGYDSGYDGAGTDAPDTGFICDPGSPVFADPSCTDEDREVCRSWAQGLAGPGVIGISTCAPGGFACFWGDACLVDGVHPPDCYCAVGDFCREGEVCVADTPDGPRRCIEACAWTRR